MMKDKKDYIVSLDKLKKKGTYPDSKRFGKGPVVVVECDQEIPCNPCETVCPKGVISVGDPITNLPKLPGIDSCTGCGLCVAACPGLAIFIIDKTYSDREALVSIPYEFLPLPQKGDPILGLDRQGESICKGKVHKVRKNKSLNCTNIVTVAVPQECADEVRFFKKEGN